VLDIANRKLNIRQFDLGDYYTQVRYVKLKHPKQATEGNFLFEFKGMIYFESDEMWLLSLLGTRSQFRFTDDYIVAGDANFGIHCYNKDGTFLYTIEANEFTKEYDDAQNMISYAVSNLKGFYGTITVNGNNCLFTVKEDNKSMLCLYDLTQKERILTRPFESGYALITSNTSIASYVYNPIRATENFLFTFNLKGDTLCRFPNYNPVPEIRGNTYNSPPSPNIYYNGGRLTIRQPLNDTVYRVISPNLLIPAYVLNFGSYRADVQTYFSGDLSEKLLPYKWMESDRYILFVYTQNRDTQNNRSNGRVQFFYSYYDKNSRQFHHFSEGTAIPEDQFLMKNPIPDAIPFILSYSEIEDKQLRVYYSKKRLEEIIKHKEFASLSSEQQNKLKAAHNELEDNEVLIMILD
jgi:hypothetical protein